MGHVNQKCETELRLPILRVDVMLFGMLGQRLQSCFVATPALLWATTRNCSYNLYMPAQALYLKYRPQSFDDVQGQDHITHTLKNALALNRIAHAYLFTGTRGTGKTSTARILAKAVNCLDPDVSIHPCNKCAICIAINQERLLDLVEIDAASNTGVDNIRDLREKIDFRPSEARYKVYIIDEVHMLSNAAFNALLKTLEEPPPHVIFILATTEVNRVPATITSRCQRFDFKRASLQELMSQLGDIANKEGMTLEPAALELVARQANGSFRDGTSLLDQLTAYSGDTITLKHVQILLGAASREIIHAIVASIAARDVGRGIAALDQAVDAGADPRQVARDVIEYLRGVMLFAVNSETMVNVGEEVKTEMRALAAQMNSEQASRAIRLFSQAALDLRNSASPTLPLEMAVVEAALEPSQIIVSASPSNARPAAKNADANPFAPRTPVANPVIGAATKTEPTFQRATTSKPKSKSPNAPESDEPEMMGELSLAQVSENWSAIIERVQQLDKNTSPLLKLAYPLSVQDNIVTIGFEYAAHKDRVEKEKQKSAVIEKALTATFGTPIRIKLDVAPETKQKEQVKNDPLIRAGMDIGGKVTRIIKQEEDKE